MSETELQLAMFVYRHWKFICGLLVGFFMTS